MNEVIKESADQAMNKGLITTTIGASGVAAFAEANAQLISLTIAGFALCATLYHQWRMRQIHKRIIESHKASDPELHE